MRVEIRMGVDPQQGRWWVSRLAIGFHYSRHGSGRDRVISPHDQRDIATINQFGHAGLELVGNLHHLGQSFFGGFRPGLIGNLDVADIHGIGNRFHDACLPQGQWTVGGSGAIATRIHGDPQQRYCRLMSRGLSAVFCLHIRHYASRGAHCVRFAP